MIVVDTWVLQAVEVKMYVLQRSYIKMVGTTCDYDLLGTDL